MEERDERTSLQGLVQVDDAYWGSERRGGCSGRDSTPSVAIVGNPEKALNWTGFFLPFVDIASGSFADSRAKTQCRHSSNVRSVYSVPRPIWICSAISPCMRTVVRLGRAALACAGRRSSGSALSPRVEMRKITPS